MTKQNGGGEKYSPEIFETVAQELTQHEQRLQELEAEKAQVIMTHDVLREIDSEERPGSDYVLREEMETDLKNIDNDRAEMESLISLSATRLNNLYETAQTEANAEHELRERDAGIEREWNELHEKVLPKVHRQVEEIQGKWEQLEHRGNTLFQRAKEIERELGEISRNEFDSVKLQYIISLILELFEVKESITTMWHAAFSPNLRKKE